MNGMAKKHITGSPPKPDAVGKRRNVVFLTLDDDTETALESFRGDQLVPPDRAAVGVKALQDFLKGQGYYPPKPSR